MIFDGCIFDPAIFEAEPCATSGGRQQWSAPRRFPEPGEEENQDDAAIILLLT